MIPPIHDIFQQIGGYGDFHWLILLILLGKCVYRNCEAVCVIRGKRNVTYCICKNLPLMVLFNI